MIILIVFLVIVGILFIGCMFGLSLSIKNTKQKKKMMAAADYNFETSYGHYKFHYMIKSFDENEEKHIKILVSPVLGFSDLTTGKTNKLIMVSVDVNDVSVEEVSSPIPSSKDYYLLDHGAESSLHGNIELVVPKNKLVDGKFAAKITVVSSWNLGGEEFDNTLDFDFDK